MKLTPHEEKILLLVKSHPDIITDSKEREKLAKKHGLSEKTLRNRIGDLKKYGIIGDSQKDVFTEDLFSSKNENDVIDLRTAFLILKSRKWTIISLSGFVTIMGIAYALLAVPLFLSTTSMYPVGETGTSSSILESNLEGIAETFGIKGLSPMPTYNIPDIVNSRRLKKDIILLNWETNAYPDSSNLIQFWEIDKPKWVAPKKWLKNFLPENPYPAEPQSEFLENAMEKLDELITVEEEISGLIVVSVLMKDPGLAADITNYIASFVKGFISNEQNKEAVKNKKFINNQMLMAKDDLTNSESKLTDFFKQNPLPSGNPDLQLEQGRLTRDVEENQAVYITLRQQYEIAKIEVEKDRLLVNVLDVGESAVKKSKPNRVLITLLSFFGGLSLAVTGVLIQENSATSRQKVIQ